jgi:hypothetical protein
LYTFKEWFDGMAVKKNYLFLSNALANLPETLPDRCIKFQQQNGIKKLEIRLD